MDHPGHTNDFIVNSEDALAVDYNDISPLENHHLAKAFKILKREEYNFLDKLDNDAYRAMRSLMIELVLATDMKRHFDILSQFQASSRPPAAALGFAVFPIASNLVRRRLVLSGGPVDPEQKTDFKRAATVGESAVERLPGGGCPSALGADTRRGNGRCTARAEAEGSS